MYMMEKELQLDNSKLQQNNTLEWEVSKTQGLLVATNEVHYKIEIQDWKLDDTNDKADDHTKMVRIPFARIRHIDQICNQWVDSINPNDMIENPSTRYAHSASTTSGLDLRKKRVYHKTERICKLCGYSSSKNLSTHKKIVHDRVKQYKCDQCVYSCSQKHHMVDHKKRIHENVKDHGCDECGYAATARGTLSLHKTRVHGKIKNEVNTSLYGCDKCDYLTDRVSNLKTQEVSS
jgi:hypothetical protein